MGFLNWGISVLYFWDIFWNYFFAKFLSSFLMFSLSATPISCLMSVAYPLFLLCFIFYLPSPYFSSTFWEFFLILLFTLVVGFSFLLWCYYFPKAFKILFSLFNSIPFMFHGCNIFSHLSKDINDINLKFSPSCIVCFLWVTPLTPHVLLLSSVFFILGIFLGCW